MKTCHRELRYLVDEYGFTEGPLVLSGTLEPFGARFDKPALSVIVQGVQWGSDISVYLQTGSYEAERAAERERLRSSHAAPEETIKSFDALRRRTQLPAEWIFDRRLPGWRARSSGSGQLALIHDYAVALRSCAGDLLGGDSNALRELFAAYEEHRRRQDVRDQQDLAAGMAKHIAQEAKRPRTPVEKVEIAQKAAHSIGQLRTESKLLLKMLTKPPEVRSLSRFAESWRSLHERLGAEIAALSHLQGLAESHPIKDGLRQAQETVRLVQEGLASGQADQTLIERVAALDPLGQELGQALGRLSTLLQSTPNGARRP